MLISRSAGIIIGLLRALDDALPALRPALAGTTAADRAWLAVVAEARPVVADVKASSHVLQNELNAAKASTAAGKASTAMSDEQVIAHGWADRTKLADHFARHGDDVGAATEAEYVQRAQDFLSRARSENLPMKVAQDGTIRVFDPETEVFASYTRDGLTRTIFKPDPPATAYWAKQKGVLQ